MKQSRHAFFKTLAVFCSLLLFPLVSTIASACQFGEEIFAELDYGLYWFGGGDACEKARAGINNAYYQPSKNTLIFIHGQQSGATEERFRETFNPDALDAGGPNINMAEFWLARRWNVGILYWNQFADEREVKNAEAKIWSANAKKKMRWRDASGNYHPDPFGLTVTELLTQNYVENLANFSGEHMRFAGHSLGGQLALTLGRSAFQAHQTGSLPQAAVPDRVVLLDAFSSNSKKSYLNNRWVGELMRDYVRELKDAGMVFESYRSSPTTSTPFVGDENRGLHNLTAFVEMKNGYFGLFDFRKKHLAAPWRYFWSIAYAPPRVYGSLDKAPSASTSDERIRFMQGSDDKGAVVQNVGQNTQDPVDDRYRYRDRF